MSENVLEKEKYKKQQNKFNKSFFIFGIVSIIIFAVASGVLFYVIGNDYGYSIFVGIVLLLGIIIIVISVIKPCIIGLKSNDETKIKMCIERLEKAKEQLAKAKELELQKDVSYRLLVDNIKSVRILDSYTEFSDKLHAVLNYQEIIQTRVYKFKVDYNDGTTKIITAAEGSEEYGILMPRVKTAPENQTNLPDSSIEQLKKYKKLLDDGIITREEFEAKKKELLS